MFVRTLILPGNGRATILWTTGKDRPRVTRVFIDDAEHREEEGTCTEIEDLADRMNAYLNGEKVTVPLDIADLDVCGAFQRSVLILECTVPRGCITTYGRIAQRLGSGARAVGNALARNPFPLIIPCHRAVRADLSIGGFQGGAAMKKALLAMEGVILDRSGRIAEDTKVWDFASLKEA
ncbi:MAG: MGMT family protein [Candidatus Fermentibacteraceae bacterium]